ncbi:MAG: hypothetical protein ACLTJ5_01425 [Clostridium sp.]
MIWLLLVAGLDETYGISIDGLDIIPENFMSVETIAEVVKKNEKAHYDYDIWERKESTGMLTVMPENEYDYDEETKEIATLQTRRLKKIMGSGKRRAAKETSTSSDFCVYGLNYMF